MKLKNNRITEATEAEMYSVWVDMEWYDLMPFDEYLRRCEKLGTKIIREEENNGFNKN